MVGHNEDVRNIADHLGNGVNVVVAGHAEPASCQPLAGGCDRQPGHRPAWIWTCGSSPMQSWALRAFPRRKRSPSGCTVFIGLWLDPAEDDANIAWVREASDAIVPYSTGVPTGRWRSARWCRRQCRIATATSSSPARLDGPGHQDYSPHSHVPERWRSPWGRGGPSHAVCGPRCSWAATLWVTAARTVAPGWQSGECSAGASACLSARRRGAVCR